MRVDEGLNLSVLPGRFAICRLAPNREIPQWALRSRPFLSITYTGDELSIVCRSDFVPPDVRCELDWAAIKVKGPLDFSLTGILASLTVPLADGGISIFAV